MMDDLWDESIKVKKRNLIAQTENRDNQFNDPRY